MVRDVNAVEEVAQAIQRLGIEQSHQPSADAEDQVPDQTRYLGKLIMCPWPKDRRPACPGAINHKADCRGDEGGKERIRLKVAFVEDIGGKQRAPKGRFEDGADA